MLESCKTAQERWGGVHELIDRWLHARQELLVHYFSVEGLDPYAPTETPLTVKIQAFCQVLVDYLSTGHFEIYEQLIQEAIEFGDGSEALAQKIIPQIQLTTDSLLNFNDKYADAEKVEQQQEQLDPDLEKLGETMAARFELEDQLIQSLHEVHRDRVA